MKLSLALLAVGFAAQDEQVLDDYVNMMMRQASGEDAGSEETNLDEAIEAKHGHGPHGHSPHNHWPHRHNPHVHTPYPTPFPTPAPTPHPCFDNTHGCEKGPGGICYPAADGSNGWSCACKNTHWCSQGCSAPHTFHTCTLITASPTTYPTPYPTSTPTPAPTPAPTATPTKVGIEEIEGIKNCCEKEIAMDVKYIMPLHTCAEVRAANTWDIREALEKLENEQGLTNHDVMAWLISNRCMHDDFGTHFPTPAPTPSPTTEPTIEPALELDDGHHNRTELNGAKGLVHTGQKDADGQDRSHFNKITLYPTPAPTVGHTDCIGKKEISIDGKKHTTTLIKDGCQYNSRDDQVEFITFTGYTSTTVSGIVGYKPVHSGGWTMSNGVSLQCWHFAGTWDAKPILDKQDSGIGYGYGYGRGPSRTHTFTYTIQRTDIAEHFIRCGIIDRSSSYCKFDDTTHCATSSAGGSNGHHYDNADAPFTFRESKTCEKGFLAAQDKQALKHVPTMKPTAFPTKVEEDWNLSRGKTNFGSVCYDKETDFSIPVGHVVAGPGKYYCNVWACQPGKVLRKSKKVCGVESYGKTFCTHTTCTRESTNEVEKEGTIAIYTFDNINGKSAFVNHINSENFKTTSTTYASQADWNWSSWYWGSFTNRYKTTYLYTSGTCKIEKYNGNMAWHVNNNGGVAGKSPCSITTATKMVIESYFDECKFSLKVTDVDYEYGSKESNDKVCFQVLDADKRTVLENKVCQNDDVRRLVDYQYQSESTTTTSNGSARCGYYGCIGWYGYGTDQTTTYHYTMTSSNYGKSANSKIITSDWIPTRNFKNGFFVKISGVTNDITEHWYADDLKIDCRTMRKSITVKHSHQEKTGGKAVCQYSLHQAARSAGRPACDCVCTGVRRQDTPGFGRPLNEKRIVSDSHDATLNANGFDAKQNSNNFYSKHSNLAYNENDQAYAGERVAHYHKSA